MGRNTAFYAQITALFLFFAINVQNISAFNQYDLNNNVDESSSNKYNTHAASTEELYANQLDSLGLRLYPGSSYDKNSQSTNGSLNHCKALVYQTLTSLPPEHREYLQHLTLYFAEGRRGLGGGSTIILRCSNITDKQLSAVLVHEMGHIVDTGLNTGNSNTGKSEFVDGNIPVYNNDPSLRFYRINWDNDTDLKANAVRSNFVTGYAMTDPFEDFAESYNFYILHNQEFKMLAKYDKTLRRKYIYMKYFVFEGQEFDYDAETVNENLNVAVRTYDSTLLNYDHETFLSSEEKDRKIATL